ncbi:hypothetical protein F6X40_17020 [Paraburkholderia sp. UCT31]|uniref:hypothetical protein n=1 Tax=Paraburkholderia sp. UCT31 TaxID=2615209 RepID=UPI00165523D3|nr:hypothetical protein [Paraburkholderia sp. UCT31]MBC8738479.1 hypothetical protein [Paraburkholderia sp. UCT31]
MMLKKACAIAVSAAILAGCSNAPLKEVPRHKGELGTAKSVKKEAEERWTEAAFESEGRPVLVITTPLSLPEDVKKEKINADFQPNATVRDLTAILGNLGLSVVISDTKAGDATFFMPHFKGRLGDMLSAISTAADVWFTWKDGVIVVTQKQHIAFTMPQDDALAKAIAAGLKTMNIGGDALVSSEAGMLSLEVTPSDLTKLKAYINRVARNSALVTLQVAVVTVETDQNDTTGIDWSGLQLAIGKGSQSLWTPPSTGSSNGTTTSITSSGGSTVNSGSGTSSGSSNVNSSGTSTGSTGNSGTSGSDTSSTITTGATTLATYGAALMTGSSAGAIVSNGVFSLTGMINFLGTYGTTSTMQNVVLKTMAGNKVTLKSVTQIPYVSGVGVSSTGTSSSSSGSSSLMGSSMTATANDGITLDLTPAFDAAAMMVSLKLNLDIEAVLAFNNLSAGNQIGNLTQPTTATRSFNDVLRIYPGQTVVIGGLSYDSVVRNQTSPLALRDTALESKALTTKHQTMFIVIRPTVKMLGSMADEKGGDELMPAADSTPAPAKRPHRHSAAAKQDDKLSAASPAAEE